MQRRPATSQPSLEVLGSSPISRLSAASCVDLEPRPLPSAGVTRLRRYYGPLRHPRRPGLSLAGVRLRVTRPHRWGFPCCVGSPCTDMPSSLPRWPAGADRSWDGLFQPFPCSPATAAFPVSVPGRLPHWSFRGLLDVHSRYGLPARRTAMRPVCLEGSDGFVASTAAPIATGWSDPVAGGDCTR